MNYEWKNMTKDMNDDSLLHFYNHEDEQKQKKQLKNVPQSLKCHSIRILRDFLRTKF